MDNGAVVVNPRIAKKLCSLGFQIIDIKGIKVHRPKAVSVCI